VEFIQGILSAGAEKVDPVANVADLIEVVGPAFVDMEKCDLLFNVLQDFFTESGAILRDTFRCLFLEQIESQLILQDVLTSLLNNPALFLDDK